MIPRVLAMSSSVSSSVSLPSVHGSAPEARDAHTAPAASPTVAKPARPYVNPNLSFDPGLGLVVIQFHDDAGKLTKSIPSQSQLDAYRVRAATAKAKDGPSSVG